MIAAAGADDFKHVGVAAVQTAVYDTDWLTPYVRRPAVAGLPGRRERAATAGQGGQPRVTAVIRTRRQDGDRTVSRPATGHGTKVARTAH